MTNFLKCRPDQVSGAIFAVVNFVVIAGWVDLSAQALGVLNIALTLVAGLFLANTTVNQVGLQQFADAQPPKP